jgi:hypothetical protein
VKLTIALLVVIAGVACEAGADDADAGILLEYADAGIPPRPDAPPDAGVEVCFEVPPMPADQLPRCTKATQDCINACAGADGCRDACIAQDTFPAAPDGQDCGDCSFRQIFSCLDRDGCHPETAGALCCLVNCAGDNACIQSECSDDITNLIGCGIGVAPHCFDDNNGDPSVCYADS